MNINVKKPSKAEIRAALEKGRELVESLSPEKEAKRRAEEARKQFIEGAMAAGFTKEMAEFLLNNFASRNHEHWNGMLD